LPNPIGVRRKATIHKQIGIYIEKFKHRMGCMSKLATLLNKLAQGEEFKPPLLPGVIIFRATNRALRAPNMLDPCIIVIGQGSKMGYLGEESFPFDEGNYLVLSQPLPFECETTASSEAPVLGISVSVNREILYELVSKIETRPSDQKNDMEESLRGMGSVALDKEMSLAVERLLICLLRPDETSILGPNLVRELIYRALCGAYGSALFAVVDKNTECERISRALRYIHTNYASPISVDLLAKKSSMSVSSFHQAFRNVTSESPIQHLKKVRLNKARELIAQEGLRASEVALLVGYGSSSQFSREFKRYFDYPPSKTVKKIV
jgi:AraC-like DNA-binding protein